MSKRKEQKRKPCAACKKSLTKRDWHYRDNGYFCNNTCFGKFVEAEAQKKEQAAV